MKKRIERGGDIYEVIDECETDYCVQVLFPFVDPVDETKTIRRPLKLWWDKKYCTEITSANSSCPHNA